MLLSPAGWIIVMDSSLAYLTLKKTIRQLQLIENAVARILSWTRKYEHSPHVFTMAPSYI